MQTQQYAYTPYYCEENIWHLCQRPEFAHLQKRVVFISNERRSCALWHQRASHDRLQPMFWDYHVILLCRDGTWQVWDLDTVLDLPTAADSYIENTFPRAQIPELYLPSFKIVEASDYVARFASDRSHMRDNNGVWLQPPPSWEPIGAGGSNLMDFLDMSDESLGQVLPLDQFRLCHN